jgi:hypothetical protein
MLNAMLQTFERRKIDPNRIFGIVVAESDDLLLIHHEYDFELDGYLVIRRRDLTKSYSSDSNAYCVQLMKKEGLWKKPAKAIRSLPLSDWRALLTALAGKSVVVENERTGAFFIGPILHCDAHAVTIHHFDGCGEWQTPERVSYRSITSVQFGNRYITIHSRYLRPRPTS